MSAPQPLTDDELAAIKARAEAAPTGSRCVCSWQMAQARHITHATDDTLRLVAEVERLREERHAIDLMDWPGEAHRLQAALNFAKGTIHDLSATVERLEDERE